MAVKSIISIDLQDEAFRRFKAQWDQYERALKNMPGAWQAVTAKIGGTRAAFDKLVDKMAAQNVQAQLFARAQEEADRRTRTLADRWAEIDRRVERVGQNIARGALGLARWVGLTGAVTGLLGAGGLWGLDRFAHGIAESRRSASRSGMAFGEREAFATAFGRVVDPESFLQSVVAAKTDITQRTGLLGAGLTPREIGAPTADTAVALLRRLRTLAQTNRPELFEQLIQARHLPVSANDLLALREMKGPEFSKMIATYAGQRNALAVPPDVAQGWQDFSTKMQAAGNSIWATFVRGLGPLTGPLEKLSGAFENLVKSALGSPQLKEWIEGAAKGLGEFAKTVGTPEFAQQVQTFVSNMAKVANALGGFVKWVADHLPGGGPAEPEPELSARFPVIGGGIIKGSPIDRFMSVLQGYQPTGGAATNWRNFLSGLSFLESGHDPAARNPTSSATGAFQFTRATAGDAIAAGLGDPRTGTYAQQADRTMRFIRQFHPEAAAAIESGDFDRAAALLRGRWPSLPGGSQPQSAERYRVYGSELRGGGPRPAGEYASGFPPVVVDVNNSTGGDTNVTVNRLRN